jgi:CheY-like chemotaxis protein
MAGDIYVTSAPGRGSTFTSVVVLKRAGDAAGAASPTCLSASAHHVLLALDQPIESRALRLSLEGAGIPLEEGKVGDGIALVSAAAAANEAFTTLIVDGHADPDVAALLLTEARKAAAHAQVQGIVVLDTAAKADFAKFRNAGFDAYLVRPVRPNSVLTLVGARTGPPTETSELDKPEHGSLVRAGCRAPLILLVEDNDINALLARRMLEKTGCEARLCLNGREAVDAIRRVLDGTDPAYDLVLMDIHMPVLDGLEATRLIKGLYAAQSEAARKPPVIALTANAFEEDRRRCLAAGMDDYLAKPFDRDDLLRLLERWCSAKASRAA